MAKILVVQMAMGKSISETLHKITFPNEYREVSDIFNDMFLEWKQMAGVSCISVFEPMSKQPLYVQEALISYINVIQHLSNGN